MEQAEQGPSAQKMLEDMKPDTVSITIIQVTCNICLSVLYLRALAEVAAQRVSV